MTVHVFLDEDENAEGQLYMDDGSSIGEFLILHSAASGSALSINGLNVKTKAHTVIMESEIRSVVGT